MRRIKKGMFLSLQIILVGSIFVQGIFMQNVYAAPSAKDIIHRVDANRNFKSMSYRASMTIQKGSRTLSKEMVGYGAERGDLSFIRFINSSDKGVKYLKRNDELWIYFPDADDVMKISGHMLRQGMMGSDLSYEDMMRMENFDKNYNSKLLDSKTIRSIDCYQVEMVAKNDEALYAKQVLYVDKKHFALVSLELYAHGGRLIKTMDMYNFKNYDGFYMGSKEVISDKRKKNSSTVMEFKTLRFNVSLPQGVFSHSYLRK